MNTRYKEVDICRGICVALDVMGHVITQND